jgi:hypothetical protein
MMSFGASYDRKPPALAAVAAAASAAAAAAAAVVDDPFVPNPVTATGLNTARLRLAAALRNTGLFPSAEAAINSIVGYVSDGCLLICAERSNTIQIRYFPFLFFLRRNACTITSAPNAWWVGPSSSLAACTAPCVWRSPGARIVNGPAAGDACVRVFPCSASHSLSLGRSIGAVTCCLLLDLRHSAVQRFGSQPPASKCSFILHASHIE